MNTRTTTSIIVILSLMFAQVAAVFALQSPSCPMMDTMTHESTTIIDDQNTDSHESIAMDCCNDMLLDYKECCDNNCSCELSMVSFASIINFDSAITVIISQSIIVSTNYQPLGAFLAISHRPPIIYIS